MSKFVEQKKIARALDNAAARADMIDAVMATQKQCWYLAKLLLDAGKTAADVDYGNSREILTKKGASRNIEMLLAA